MANKIKYGVKSVHYAVATIAADGTATYETPVPWPGAVTLTLDAQGEQTPFYADNIVYYMGNSNTGYSGSLECALVPDSFYTDVLGYVADSKGVLVEDANAPAVHFALLFQFEGDVKATRHAMFNVTATRPSASGTTKSASIEPQTETVNLTATTVYNASLETDITKASTHEATDATTYSTWFSAVHQPEKATNP